ncbi:MAG: helix-turn-helix transcriptional regulator [Proteobacteria bacterium]|nr:helix-turn-helix transcriptional regulator [Pseudomonadota bacterium]
MRGRMSGDQVLGHPIRKAVVDLLWDREGGLPLTAIHNELPDSPDLSTLSYHVRVLCAYGFVKSEGDNTATPVYVLA